MAEPYAYILLFVFVPSSFVWYAAYICISICSVYESRYALTLYGVINYGAIYKMMKLGLLRRNGSEFIDAFNMF